MNRTVKIGLVQVCQHSSDDYDTRISKLLDSAERCYYDGAELVFFPEAYQHVPNRGIVYLPEILRKKAAEFKEQCSALAQKHNAYIVPWDYEATPDGKIYNSSYILDRSGKEVGRFRKVHLTHTEEMRGISHGEDFPVFDLDFGKVGIMICWDNYFPESARVLGNRGAELILYPLYGDTLYPAWELKLRTRAADNCMYIASCQIGPTSDIAFTGLVDPRGEIVARLDTFPSHMVVDVEMGMPVDTHTTGRSQFTENLRKYTASCRYPKAYSGLLEEPPEADWNEIFYGNPPKVELKEEYLRIQENKRKI